MLYLFIYFFLQTNFTLFYYRCQSQINFILTLHMLLDVFFRNLICGFIRYMTVQFIKKCCFSGISIHIQRLQKVHQYYL